MTIPRLLLSLATLAAATLPASAQATWLLRSPPQSPTHHSDGVLVYDFTRARCWLSASTTSALMETWSFDGTTWANANPATSPPIRIRHAGAFDSLRARFVLFGGSAGTNSGHYGDTWEFDGTTWQQMNPAQSPSPRNDCWMAFDAARGKSLLFGGQDQNGVYAETWEWDGSQWTQLAPPNVPPGRRDFNMVYDSDRQRVVMFGGFPGLGLGSPLNDTWEWSGSDWTQVATSASPQPRGGHVLAYDSLRQRTVLYSGYPAGNDTWEYDGTTWLGRTPLPRPTTRSGHTMAYDTLRQRIVMVGGYDSTFRNDTWEYFTANPGVATSFGAGCTGSAGVPVLAAAPGQLPWVGDTFTQLGLQLPPSAPATILVGGSNTTWSGFPLPLDLTIVGMPGCSLLVSIDVALGVTNSGGTVTFPLAIPSNPSLIGQTVHDQLFVLDAPAPTTTNGVTSTIGAR